MLAAYAKKWNLETDKMGKSALKLPSEPFSCKMLFISSKWLKSVKVGLSPSKKLFIYFNESPLKMMKSVFYVTLKVLFVHNIFELFLWPFSHLQKTAGLER